MMPGDSGAFRNDHRLLWFVSPWRPPCQVTTSRIPIHPTPLTPDMERRKREIQEWLDRRERELGLVKDEPPGTPKQSHEK